MINYPNITTIRYMGNKNKLLSNIVPEIEKLTNPGDVICDIMAGTNSIGYACKDRNIVVSNDIQEYSYVIGKCLLSNYEIPSAKEIHNDIDEYYLKNINIKEYSFFIDNYVDTYFSYEQCLDIDSLRYAIEKVTNENKKNFYLTLLMSAMCKAQSTTGHFAQYLSKEHSRVHSIRSLSIYKLFYEKVKDFNNFIKSNYQNFCYNLDYKELFQESIIRKVKCFYLDSPYTTDQYSRFYHVLETVCKYDYPKLKYKAKYREDRVKSEFCYKNLAVHAFETIISKCKNNNSSLVISYSNKGVVAVEEIIEVAKRYYESVNTIYSDYEHSSQGKGLKRINEVLIIMK